MTTGPSLLGTPVVLCTLAEKPIKKQPNKIAVTAAQPSLDAAVEPRFGRCPYFVLVDPETGAFEALKNTNTDGRGAGVQSARMIASKGAKVLLTGKCGASAVRALSTERIEVVEGCSGTVREVIERYKAGELRPAKDGKARGSQPAQDTPPQ
jgi:predicted Fe-Mo cluster-binding NifX family protein